MTIQDIVDRIDEINRLIDKLVDERQCLNDNTEELPVIVRRDWGEDKYPYTVLNDEREVLTAFDNKHAAFRDLVRESRKYLSTPATAG